MTVTHNDETESGTETETTYAVETDTIDGTRIHDVMEVEGDQIRTRCGRSVSAFDAEIKHYRPPELSGNTICYDCVRGEGGVRR